MPVIRVAKMNTGHLDKTFVKSLKDPTSNHTNSYTDINAAKSRNQDVLNFKTIGEINKRFFT